MYQVFESSSATLYPFYKAVYYASITVIGRPGVPFSTVESAVFLTILSVLAATIIPTFVAELIRLWYDHSSVDKMNGNSENPHVIVCGDTNPSRLKIVAEQFFHPSRKLKSISPLVILGNRKPDMALKMFLDQYKHTGNVQYIRGSAKRASDLIRADALNAAKVIVLNYQSDKTVDYADGEVLASVMSIKAVKPSLQVVVQVQRPRKRNALRMVPGWDAGDIAVSTHPIGMTLVGLSTFLPGFSTLVSNLLNRQTPERASGLRTASSSSTHAPGQSSSSGSSCFRRSSATSKGPKNEAWRDSSSSTTPTQEYMQSVQNHVVEIPMYPPFEGLTFATVARFLFFRYNLLLFATTQATNVALQQLLSDIPKTFRMALFPYAQILKAENKLYVLTPDNGPIRKLRSEMQDKSWSLLDLHKFTTNLTISNKVQPDPAGFGSNTSHASHGMHSSSSSSHAVSVPVSSPSEVYKKKQEDQCRVPITPAGTPHRAWNGEPIHPALSAKYGHNRRAHVDIQVPWCFRDTPGVANASGKSPKTLDDHLLHPGSRRVFFANTSVIEELQANPNAFLGATDEYDKPDEGGGGGPMAFFKLNPHPNRRTPAKPSPPMAAAGAAAASEPSDPSPNQTPPVQNARASLDLDSELTPSASSPAPDHIQNSGHVHTGGSWISGSGAFSLGHREVEPCPHCTRKVALEMLSDLDSEVLFQGTGLLCLAGYDEALLAAQQAASSAASQQQQVHMAHPSAEELHAFRTRAASAAQFASPYFSPTLAAFGLPPASYSTFSSPSVPHLNSMSNIFAEGLSTPPASSRPPQPPMTVQQTPMHRGMSKIDEEHSPATAPHSPETPAEPHHSDDSKGQEAEDDKKKYLQKRNSAPRTPSRGPPSYSATDSVVSTTNSGATTFDMQDLLPARPNRSTASALTEPTPQDPIPQAQSLPHAQAQAHPLTQQLSTPTQPTAWSNAPGSHAPLALPSFSNLYNTLQYHPNLSTHSSIPSPHSMYPYLLDRAASSSLALAYNTLSPSNRMDPSMLGPASPAMGLPHYPPPPRRNSLGDDGMGGLDDASSVLGERGPLIGGSMMNLGLQMSKNTNNNGTHPVSTNGAKKPPTNAFAATKASVDINLALQLAMHDACNTSDPKGGISPLFDAPGLLDSQQEPLGSTYGAHLPDAPMHSNHILICGVSNSLGFLIRAINSLSEIPEDARQKHAGFAVSKYKPFEYRRRVSSVAADVTAWAVTSNHSGGQNGVPYNNIPASPVVGARQPVLSDSTGSFKQPMINGDPFQSAFGAVLPSMLPIVILSPEPPDVATLDSIYPNSASLLARCHFIKGHYSIPEDLHQAGVRNARAVIILSSSRPTSIAANSLDDDCDAIAATRVIRTLAPTMHTITELNHGHHATFVAPVGASLQDNARHCFGVILQEREVLRQKRRVNSCLKKLRDRFPIEHTEATAFINGKGGPPCSEVGGMLVKLMKHLNTLKLRHHFADIPFLRTPDGRSRRATPRGSVVRDKALYDEDLYNGPYSDGDVLQATDGDQGEEKDTDMLDLVLGIGFDALESHATPATMANAEPQTPRLKSSGAPNALYLSPSYASGCVYSLSTMDSILTEAHYAPYVVNCIKSLVAAARQHKLVMIPAIELITAFRLSLRYAHLKEINKVFSSENVHQMRQILLYEYLTQIAEEKEGIVPGSSISKLPPISQYFRYYGEFYDMLIRCWKLLPIGLYRRALPTEGTPTPHSIYLGVKSLTGFPSYSTENFAFSPTLVSYTFTNPLPSTRVTIHDIFYVLRPDHPGENGKHIVD